MNDSNTQLDAIILAAGKGTRMQSDLPKVMHEVADRPMINWVIDATRKAGARRIIVVVGHRGDLVREELAGQDDIEFVEQAEQLGTGHAVDMAREAMAGSPDNDVFVLCGDGPLIRSETLDTLRRKHAEEHAAGTLATAIIDDPSGYGRIARDASSNFDRIVEQKDATEEQLAIREINPSYYCFRSGHLFEQLSRISNDNASGEYYVTDVFRLLLDEEQGVSVVAAVPAEDVLSINTLDHLSEVDSILRNRIVETANGSQA
ncbi:MAG: NTP transferase domain-containing protein [Phycisphaerales bacterium]|nr:NTP transferase domain-containing protein [Phycisphaerales bacterium]